MRGGIAFLLLALAGQASPSGSIHERIAAHAIEQTTWGTRYDARYERIAYPNGDVPRSRGVCTDVVIRALRSVGYDLQRLIHEDARKHPRRYPRIDRLDRNIDHRRCPNQVAYFRAYGRTISHNTARPTWSDWKPGDIVFWVLDNGRDHVGIVTAKREPNGKPWVVHNLGGTRHENVLTQWRLVGRFRFPSDRP